MIPITKPTLSPYEEYADKFREIIVSGQITNGKYVKELEEKVATYLGVSECVAVSSCTSGMMLVLKGLGVRGEVILPSFTFSATGHIVLWNNLTPVFADILKDVYTVDPEAVEKKINKNTGAILATHIFGNPCEVKKLEDLTKKYNVKLVFDAAHAFGSSCKGKKIGGFGDAEIFSCSPTKLLTTAEGGFIATNNKELADFCRIGRNYGDDGSYNTKFNGLNARMSEFHAVVGLESLKCLDENVEKRNMLVQYYKKKLSEINPKIEFQIIPSDCVTTYKDFSIYINPEIGFTRDELCDYLFKKEIVSKKYFYPPLHKQLAYEKYMHYDSLLPATNDIADRVLSLPLFSHMTKNEIDHIVQIIKEFQYAHTRN